MPRTSVPAAAAGPPSTGRLRWPWPLPALLAWGAAFGLWWALRAQGLSAGPALMAASALGVALSLPVAGSWRKCLVALGFPLAALAQGAAAEVPAWAWLAAPLLLLALYPPRAWKDAPFFPTPAAALQGLPAVVGEPSSVLDAGCGLGHGLRALHGLWPGARLSGVEWSRPLAWATRLRCPFAQVRRGDMWAGSWGGQELVYLFQRPETMGRAWRKAQDEMAAGAWFVSLAFEVPGVEPWARLQAPGQQPVFIYRIGATALRSTARRPGR